MRFSSIALRDVTSYVVGVTVAVTMAWLGAGYWSIVALPLTLNLTQMVLSWLMVKWKPGLPHSDPEVRSMIGFGGNIAVSYVIFNWISNADNILIGWYWEPVRWGCIREPISPHIGSKPITARPSALRYPLSAESRGMRKLFARYYLRHHQLDRMDQRFLFGFFVCCLQTSHCPRAWSEVAASSARFPGPYHPRLWDNCFSSRRCGCL